MTIGSCNTVKVEFETIKIYWILMSESCEWSLYYILGFLYTKNDVIKMFKIFCIIKILYKKQSVWIIIHICNKIKSNTYI